MLFQKFQREFAVVKLREIRYTYYIKYVWWRLGDMATPGKVKATIKINEQSSLRNQFILFYTLRELWKLYGNETGGLYKVLFPSKNQAGGNKTKYDNILKLQDVNLLSQSSNLADLTGLSEQHFTGERMLQVGQLPLDDWKKFIQLRKSQGVSGGEKSLDLRQTERKIKDEIRNATEWPDKQNATLKKLMYFAQYGKKQANRNLQDKFKEIENVINELQPGEFRQADLEVLKAHQIKIQNHLQRIMAALTMQQWEKEQR